MAQITITLDDGEQNAFHQLLDAAVKHSGIGAAQAAAYFITKLDAARNATATPSEAPSNASGE